MKPKAKSSKGKAGRYTSLIVPIPDPRQKVPSQGSGGKVAHCVSYCVLSP